MKKKLTVLLIILVLLGIAGAVYLRENDSAGNLPEAVDPTGNLPETVDPTGNLPEAVDPTGNLPEAVDSAAYALFREQLDAQMAGTLAALSQEQPGLTGYAITRLVPILSVNHPYKDQLTELYDFDYALLCREPSALILAEGQYLDDQQRLCGVNSGGPFAVLYRDGQVFATAFMGQDFSLPPEGADGGEAAYAWVFQTLVAEACDLRVDYATDALLSQFSAYESFPGTKYERDSEHAIEVLLLPKTPLESFRYLSILCQSGYDSFFVKDVLFETDTLSPDCPLVVTLVFVGTFPTQAVSFVDAAGATRYYAIVPNYVTGSLMLIELGLALTENS